MVAALLLLVAMDVATIDGAQHHVARIGHGVIARDLGDGNVEVACEPAPETSAQRVERLTRELEQARTALRLERAAKRVNEGMRRRRGAR